MTLPETPLSLAYMQPAWQTVHSAWAEHLPAAFWLIETLRPRRFVELGSHAGDSYCAFVQAMTALGLDQQGATAMAVDCWEGDKHSGAYTNAIYEKLAAYHNAHYSHFSRLNKCFFDQACQEESDGGIDLLHIDGLHTYEAVKDDFESWLPKMSARGVILFHDVTEHREDFGVWQLWDELTPRYAHLLLPHCHGLGILAVGEDVPEDFLRHLAPAGETSLNAQQQTLIDWLAALGRGCETNRETLDLKRHAECIQRDHDELLRNFHALEQRLIDAQQTIHHMRASSSWRITAPLRRILGAMKRA